MPPLSQRRTNVPLAGYGDHVMVDNADAISALAGTAPDPKQAVRKSQDARPQMPGDGGVHRATRDAAAAAEASAVADVPSAATVAAPVQPKEVAT